MSIIEGWDPTAKGFTTRGFGILVGITGSEVWEVFVSSPSSTSLLAIIGGSSLSFGSDSPIIVFVGEEMGVTGVGAGGGDQPSGIIDFIKESEE